MSGTSGTYKSSPHSGNFEQKLNDDGIYLNNRGHNPQNWTEIKEHLPPPRLSHSQFSDGDFDAFVEDDERELKESRAMTARNIFGNLDSPSLDSRKCILKSGVGEEDE
jgi:hypothetical protein